MIIDFHVHTFPDKIAKKTIDRLAAASQSHPFADGTAAGLIDAMRRSGVTHAVSLPVATSVKQVEKVNTGLIENQEELRTQGIIPFGCMHPDVADVRGECKRLKKAGIPGIKLHPPYQQMDFDDIRMQRTLAAAFDEDLIVSVHAGIDIGIYDHNYISVQHILKVLKAVPPRRLVLAHMGNWAFWEEVESDLAGAPVWLDTAFSIGPITPLTEESRPYLRENLTEEDFIRLSRKHGTDRILFATDSPWADPADYIQRIRAMALTEEEQDKILYKNGAALLGL